MRLRVVTNLGYNEAERLSEAAGGIIVQSGHNDGGTRLFVLVAASDIKNYCLPTFVPSVQYESGGSETANNFPVSSV